MKRSTIFFVLLAVLAAVALYGCGGSGGTAATATGGVQVNVTDAPGDFDHVYITVKDVWFHTSSTAGPASSGWLEYPLASPVTLDLLDLSNGSMQALWDGIQLPVGTYRQIRLFLEPTYPTATNPAPTGHTYFNEVVTSQSGTAPLYVPDPVHGIRLVGTFGVTTGSTLKLAIDFDAGHDIVEFHEGTDYILKPTLTCFDLDHAGAIIGTLSTGGTFTDAARFVIKAERLATPQEMIDSGATGTYHVIRRWTVPRADGTFVLYPISTRVTGTWDVVIRGLNTKTMIVKGVTVATGATPMSGATDLGIVATAATGSPDYPVAGTIQAPTGAWVQFYQTLPAAGEFPYEIRFRHFNPLWGGFRQTFMLNQDQILVADFASSGSTLSFTPATPAEGIGNYNAVAGARLFDRSSPSLVSSATTTVQFNTLSVISSYQSRTVSGSIVMNNFSMMKNTMNSGVLFAVHGGMIVNAINIGSDMSMGGAYAISSLPGGSLASPLSGAFYGIDAVGWDAPLPSAYNAVAIPQVVDLSTGDATADMDMFPPW